MNGGASGGAREGYVPPPEFLEDAQEALVDLDASGSTELWLIQWPRKMNSQLKLNHDGNWGTFEDFSGKEYDLVSSAALKPNATVFTSSSSGYAKRKKLASDDLKSLHQEPFGTSVTDAFCQFSCVTTNSKWRGSRSSKGASHRKLTRRHPRESTASSGLGNSIRDSGHGHGRATTSAGFSENSRYHGSAASSQAMEHSVKKSKDGVFLPSITSELEQGVMFIDICWFFFFRLPLPRVH
ncbi:hypothetical protein ACJRO7_024989 [Eucalyptus globulus]|uniref:Uncharacterized protein n=1 Tax=Eucalyptus globulus TaxID=34317 RepID=A0ABD3K9E7_EUCGL